MPMRWEMYHNFNIEIAKEYGINCAIILENLNYWIEKNKANDNNFYDGYYWTYNSVKAFNELFPYMSAKQIETALKKLENEGIIITGNYNQLAYDRTKWYAITQKGKCILQNGEMELPKMSNGFNKNDEPIPNNKPNNKPNSNTDSIKKNKSNKNIKTSAKELKEMKEMCITYSRNDTELENLLYQFIDMREKKHRPLTKHALELRLKQLDGLATTLVTKEIVVEQSVKNKWDEFYEWKGARR